MSSNKKNDDKPVAQGRGLGSLAGFKASTPAAPTSSTAPKPPAAGGAGVARLSTKVSNSLRAGRAPYNFVPLPDCTHWLPFDEEPQGLDQYRGRSGWIDVRLEAKTHFYIRGMWPLGEHTGDKQTLPFAVDGQLRIPGSSWRGMVRSLVEILGDSPLDPVNDDQLFFRAVGANVTPGEQHFDPNAQTYKDRAVEVQAGYLTGDRDGWYIRSAMEARKRYKIHITALPDEDKWWKRKDVYFVVTDPDRARLAAAGEPGAKKGSLISSGTIGKQWIDYRDRRRGSKQYQWLIHEPDPKAKPIKIPPSDLKAYLEGGVTQELRGKRFTYDYQSKAAPCFFVEWEGHVWFGHTPFFRFPYANTVGDRIPVENRREKGESRWDLAQAVFGRVSGEGVNGQRGRVYFEDAFLAPKSTGNIDQTAQPVVLGTPKPTTYSHYLVQRTEKLEDSIHWDGNYRNQGDAVVRGHKGYWHRPDAPGASQGVLPKVDRKQEAVASWIQPAQKGAVFTARLRFENLRDWELGALLMAIDLPVGCAHKLGMAKPLGLGSFRLSVVSLQELDRSARYGSLFEDDDAGEVGSLATGAVESKGVRFYQAAFEDWYWKSQPTERRPFWDHPRMAQLLCLLKSEGLPGEWTSITRYLRFGKVNGQLYNEYLRPQKRRPLPPACQVLDADPQKIPSDDPTFELQNGPLAPRRGAVLK